MTPSAAYAPAPCRIDRVDPPQESVSNPIAARLRANGSVCFRVLGASMFPWVRSGDLVFVRKFAFEQVSRGDVILFERGERLFVHRVLRGTKSVAGRASNSVGDLSNALVTKGDALDRVDTPVSRAEFLGRVIRVHRGNHHIDMESMGRVLLGRLLARVSRMSFIYYRPIRAVKHLLFG
jgi:signal peptidase I